jgi:two-component system, NarL family, response regulator DegU
MGLGMGFSKPVRLEKNRARLENLRRIEDRIDPAGSVATPEIDAAAPRPKVLITDDQALFRAGLARLRAADARLRVINPTDEGQDTVERTLGLTPDLVLMDLHVPSFGSLNDSGNGSESSTLKVVVLAADFDQETVRAIQSGSSQDFIPDGVVSRILALYASKDPNVPTRKPEVSKRELSVLSHVAAGQSNKQIGKLLGISQKTVRNHLTRIFHKLRANNRTEAVMNAMRLGLLTM